MFSDTHFHFKSMTERGIDGAEVLSAMASRDCFFGLDIGTEADDLQERQKCAADAIKRIKDAERGAKARDFLHFSAGIWPSVDAIRARKEQVAHLKDCIQAAEKDASGGLPHKKIAAIGECGLDRHWNPAGTDGRNEADFDAALISSECELFEMQLDLARQMRLPVVVHSRDAFEDTLACIKNVGYDNGIIHCYSYGAAEAEAFLARGWHISLSGSITYTKKSKLEDAERLIKTIPDDKLLCETDSPYLAPVPHRGKTNTPLLVEHTYAYIAKLKGMTAEELSALVDKNVRKMIGILT
ncbi:MAG: TatD family hydrolase [Treponema sp.]